MTTIRELRSEDQLEGLVELARMHHEECAVEGMPFEREPVLLNGMRVILDTERNFLNVWIAYKDDEPIGYCVGRCIPYFFNNEKHGWLDIWYVAPKHRKGWAAIKLIKSFEEWSRLNGVLQIFAGVARSDKDEAKHIRKLFPKLSYEWCGSYYVKDTL